VDDVTGPGTDEAARTALADAFEHDRGRLTAVAARMLGSRADGEDAVQEAWIRLARQDAGSIDNLSGWLTTVVSRVCLDTLRARKAKAEQAWDDAREWVVTADDESGPEGSTLVADSVGAALLVVLDALSPDERLAFVLHDVFGVPFAEIGSMLDKSTDAAKMLASRARRKVRGQREPVDRRRERAVVDAFLDAARAGNFERLLEVLHPDLVWRIHTARGEIVRHGATVLAEHGRRGARVRFDARSVRVDGRPGVVVRRPDGTPLVVMACTVVDGRIVEIESVTDPARLRAMHLPPRSA